MLTYCENLLIFYQMRLSSRRSGYSYNERQPTPSSGTPVVIEEVVEVREAQEAAAAAADLAEQLKPRNRATTRDLMLPQQERLAEIGIWIEGS